MCYDKEKNGKESDYHGKMEQKIIRSCSNRQCRSRSGLLFKEVKENEDDDFNDDFEDEDFDLDNDLQPVDRGYVDLNAAKTTTEEDNAADDSTEDTSADNTEDTSEDADAKDTPDTSEDTDEDDGDDED